MAGKPKNMTGERYGRLVAVSMTDKRAHGTGAMKWVFRCDCGEEIVKPGTAVRNGSIRSCGCLQKDLARACPHKDG